MLTQLVGLLGFEAIDELMKVAVVVGRRHPFNLGQPFHRRSHLFRPASAVLIPRSAGRAVPKPIGERAHS
jgi:hypothetical protein